MKKAIFVFCAMVLLATATFAGGQKDAKKITVAASVIDLSNVYFVQFSNGIKKACVDKGYNFVLNDGKTDPAVQIAAIENFIVQQVDVLIISPVDPKALAPVLAEAKKQGIMIINCDQEVETKDAFLKINEYEYGYAAGKIAADWINAKGLKNAKVAVLNRPITQPLIQRSDGFKDGVTKNSSAVIVAEQVANTAELGLKAAESILQAHPDVAGFVCQNDTAALGVYEVYTALGKKNGDVFITAVDGIPQAFEKIAQNSIFIGTVSANPEGRGVFAVNLIEDIQKNGPKTEPIYPPVMPVTKANVNDFVKK